MRPRGASRTKAALEEFVHPSPLELKLEECTRQRENLQRALNQVNRLAIYCAPNNINLVEAARRFQQERQKAEEICDTALLQELHEKDLRHHWPPTIKRPPSRKLEKAAKGDGAAPSPLKYKPSLSHRHLLYLDLTRKDEFAKEARKNATANLSYMKASKTAGTETTVPERILKSAERLHRGKERGPFDEETISLALHGQPTAPRKFEDEDEMEEMVQRLVNDEVSRRATRLEMSRKKFYPEEEPRLLTPQALAQSVARQDAHLRLRQERRRATEEKWYPVESPRLLSEDEIQASANRLSVRKAAP